MWYFLEVVAVIIAIIGIFVHLAHTKKKYQDLSVFIDATPCGLTKLEWNGYDFRFTKVNKIAVDIVSQLGGPRKLTGKLLCDSVPGHCDPNPSEGGLTTKEIYRRVAFKEYPYESGRRDAVLEFDSPVRNEKSYYQQRVLCTKPGVISIGFFEITEKMELIEKLRKQSITHQLTGLYTRNYIYHALNDAINRVNRGDESCYIRIDLDEFGQINKLFGHQEGDKAIVWASKQIKDCTRNGEPVGCMGGDEFAAIIAGDIIVGKRVAERIKDKLDKTIYIAGKPYKISASVGVVAISNVGSQTVDSRADSAQREAKRLGKNKVIVWSDNNKIDERYQLEQRLIEALRNEEFILHYQPIVSIETNVIQGYEALVRWKSPKGLIYPNVFIDTLEDLNKLHLLTTQIFKLAAAKQAELIKNETDPKNIKWISVNVSPSDLDRDDFKTIAKPLLDCHPIGHIEITEKLQLTLKARDEVTFLQDVGYKIALDDFGSGYSRYLELKDVNLLKIDKSLIDDITNSDKAFKLCSGIVALARILELDIIAEGVETQDQLDALRLMKCTYAQGYLFSKPGPM